MSFLKKVFSGNGIKGFAKAVGTGLSFASKLAPNTLGGFTIYKKTYAAIDTDSVLLPGIFCISFGYLFLNIVGLAGNQAAIGFSFTGVRISY